MMEQGVYIFLNLFYKLTILFFMVDDTTADNDVLIVASPILRSIARLF
jgi:hypothetical protein